MYKHFGINHVHDFFLLDSKHGDDELDDKVQAFYKENIPKSKGNFLWDENNRAGMVTWKLKIESKQSSDPLNSKDGRKTSLGFLNVSRQRIKKLWLSEHQVQATQFWIWLKSLWAE